MTGACGGPCITTVMQQPPIAVRKWFPAAPRRKPARDGSGVSMTISPALSRFMWEVKRAPGLGQPGPCRPRPRTIWSAAPIWRRYSGRGIHPAVPIEGIGGQDGEGILREDRQRVSGLAAAGSEVAPYFPGRKRRRLIERDILAFMITPTASPAPKRFIPSGRAYRFPLRQNAAIPSLNPLPLRACALLWSQSFLPRCGLPRTTLILPFTGSGVREWASVTFFPSDRTSSVPPPSLKTG